MRVMVASDQPEVRRYLGRVTTETLGGVVVGEGDNAVRALQLARRLRPDIAFIDSYLPHSIGLDGVSLSRGAGLDTAQAISAEIPNVRTVLVDRCGPTPVFLGGLDGIQLRPLPVAGAPPSSSGSPLTFASLTVKSDEPRRHSVSDILFGIGVACVLVGAALIATMFLAYVGLPLFTIGLVSTIAGCVAKLVSPVKRRPDQDEGR